LPRPPPSQLIKRRSLAARVAAKTLAPPPPPPPPAPDPEPKRSPLLGRPPVGHFPPGQFASAHATTVKEGRAARTPARPPSRAAPVYSAPVYSDRVRHGTVGLILQKRAAADAAGADSEAIPSKPADEADGAPGPAEEYDRDAVAACLRRLRGWRDQGCDETSP
jgi:hypothetical protein